MRKFLYIIVAGILLSAAALFALRLYGERLTELVLVPSAPFEVQGALADNAYADPAMWFSRPGMDAPADPARWQPPVDAEKSLPAATPLPSEDPAATSAGPVPRFAVFFIHPTSYYSGQRWNAPLDDEGATTLARNFVRGMASAFNPASEIWAPRYRQAAFGAFVTTQHDAQRALDAAYADVAQAFDFFLASLDADTPFVLAGHSQGSVHLLRLLREKVAGTDLEPRLAMAYPIGWPISVAHDLPALPLPACADAQQTRCILAYASFAEPAEPGQFMTRYAAEPGADGQPRGAGDPILCVNPLTGAMGGVADISRNYGTLVPDANLESGELIAGAVPARCDPATGLLLIGDPPRMGPFVLPGNNYHSYDIPLFWANLRADVTRRMRAFAAR
ncbi:DUF3089 domain-containing protein [Altererythrobacter lauratis]|uniref:DUF3089 domain-containing protein n=1 Tax=Alteraurantiacibacter lauratis TaxID=2054627 RepID=A0ABV7EJZ9_9SPHN